jgi:hypothetical protein
MASQPPFFDLDEPDYEPLEMAPSSPQMSAPQSDKAKWIKLALIAPLLAKGGPGAIEGFLSGMNAANRRRAAEQQQYNLDTERINHQNAVLDQRRAYQDDVIAGQQQSRQQALLKQYSDAINGASTPDEVQAIRSAYIQQAQGIGMRPGAFDSIALTQTPDRLKQKRIASTWAKLPAESKQEALKNGWTLNVDGEMVPFEQWSSQVGAVVDPVTGKPPVAPQESVDLSKSSLDVQAAAALKRGDQAEYDRLKKVADEMGTARRADVDTQLQGINRQIAQARLENLQAPKDAGQLPPRISRQVDMLSRGFDTQPITRTIQKMAEAASFAESFDPNTKNPADDQALIYAFAKAMDPDSVVREGEYATVQKYSQSWAEMFGFQVARIFSNEPFLTAEARANMKATIMGKYASARPQYDNVRSQYVQRINKATGTADGEEYLIDYGAAFPVIGARPNANGRTRGAGASKPNPYRPTK